MKTNPLFFFSVKKNHAILLHKVQAVILPQNVQILHTTFSGTGLSNSMWMKWALDSAFRWNC